MFDNDQSSLELIFDSIIATDLKTNLIINNVELVDLIEQIKRFKYYELNTSSSEVQDFYILYLISNLVTSKLETYNLQDIDSDYYLPIITNILITQFDNCKKILSRDVKLIYKQVQDASENIIDFYLSFYNSESNVIQTDILNIFLIKIFREHNPLNVDNLREYYNSLLRYLFYSYLKSKTDGLIDADLSPVITKEERYILQSIRSQLYNNGIKATEILQLCNESTTLKKINKNYYKLKSNILTNELQKIYSVILNKDTIEDPRFLAILTNSDKSIDLDNIKRKCPIIYKILRCVKVDRPSKISNIFNEQINNSIYSSLYVHFNGLVPLETLTPALKNISNKISLSICNGTYIDILTLEIMSIENSNFLIQLKTFFNIILSEIEHDLTCFS